ncbi:hypothetical protein CDIK_2473 [Cucumispora dikerogammari]|nr:hypothetical protein CDIK_2473 [Cucumispora dikerogammari]
MKYIFSAHGTYTNISNLNIPLTTISTTIKCTNCGLQHINNVTLCDTSVNIDKGGNKWNLIVNCKDCDHMMKLSIESKDSKSKNINNNHKSKIVSPENEPNIKNNSNSNIINNTINNITDKDVITHNVKHLYETISVVHLNENGVLSERSPYRKNSAFINNNNNNTNNNNSNIFILAIIKTNNCNIVSIPNISLTITTISGKMYNLTDYELNDLIKTGVWGAVETIIPVDGKMAQIESIDVVEKKGSTKYNTVKMTPVTVSIEDFGLVLELIK